MSTYIACTLGPIYKTIIQQRKTRSVFAASYLFSYIMKMIMKELGNGVYPRILLPSPDFLSNPDFIHPGCGLYPDRMIIKSAPGDMDKLLAARKKVLKHLAGKDAFRGDVPEKYLNAYLKIYLLETELSDGSETINQINQQLNTLELVDNFPPEEDPDYLIDFFDKVKGHFILEDALGPQNRKDRFDTLTEIATRELKRIPGNEKDYDEIVEKEIESRLYPAERDVSDREKKGKDEDDHFYEALFSKFEEDLKPYHRYVAVVNADGDNFGKYIEAMNADEGRLKGFSRDLIRFGKAARDLIEDYGGASVYIGGDDLLFFAPVVSRFRSNNEVSKSIFELIFSLDELFYGFFDPKEGSPTLSYGISFTYHKYPLNEALKESHELLEKIKENYIPPAKKKHPQKNAIAFKVLKHSGQFFEAVIDKDKPGIYSYTYEESVSENIPFIGSIYTQFLELIKNQVNNPNFINSLTHGMAFFQDLFEEFLISNPDPQAIQNLFDNSFNESIHNQNRTFINSVVQYVQSVYAHLNSNRNAYQSNKEMSEEALSIIYSTLRFIHFIGHSS